MATFKGHLFGIKTFFEQGTITNGVLESLNSKVQLAKRRARGYANVNNFMDMVYYCSVNFDMAHIICIFVSKSHDTIHY
nr:transposase [Tannerella forsythia]